MVDKYINIPMKDNPVLLDRILQDIQLGLKKQLPWLNYAFGKSYRLVEHKPNGDKYIYPAAYIGDSDYVSLLPNDNFGNFSWFDIYDPESVTEVFQSSPQFSYSGAIVFWFNLDTIFSDADAIYTEEVKQQVLNALLSPGLIKNTGKIKIKNVYERFEFIYSGYSIEKVYNSYAYKSENIQDLDKQFFMHPYGGLRIEFEITTRELCQRFIK